MKSKAKRIAMVLSGCGNKDGTEITEAVSAIIALHQFGAEVQYFAPSLEITPKNFLTDKPISDTRNILVESARITRSQIQELSKLNADEFDGLIFPGGYGAALYLSNWATLGAKCEVLPDIQKTITSFFHQSKPIGAICIAPVLIAKVLGHEKVNLTLGSASEASHEVEKTGAIHEVCPVTDYITDRGTKVITTPAYMYSEAKPHEVFVGISGLAKELMEMA